MDSMPTCSSRFPLFPLLLPRRCPVERVTADPRGRSGRKTLAGAMGSSTPRPIHFTSLSASLLASRRAFPRSVRTVCYHSQGDPAPSPRVRLLVTGGAGYIGSVVAKRLLGDGHEVVILDNLERGHREAVPDGAELVVAELLDQPAVEQVVSRGFDGALHFAALALVAESVAHPERYYRTNLGGTLSLLEAMRKHGVARLVFSSTCATYGYPDKVPIAEDSETRPITAYGASKLAVDWMIRDFCAAHDIGAVSLRYFNVAGASGELGEDHEPETHIIPNVLRAVLGINPHVQVFGTDYPTRDGTAVRDYIHIDDLTEAHVLALGATTPGQHKL